VVGLVSTALGQRWYDGNDHMDGGWWWLMGVGMILMLVALVVIAVMLLSNRGSPASESRGGTRSAEGILADRFARGEIDGEEFRCRRDALRE